MPLKKFSFLDDFEVPEITHENIKSELIKVGKIHTAKKSVESMPIEQRLKYIEENVNKILGRYKGYVRVIDNDDDLVKYIDKAIEIGYLSIDTETNNSLDPLTCKIMGVCLCTPNSRPVYVPINHTYPGTDRLLENQVSIECLTECFKKLRDSSIKLIYHHGKFDIEVIFNTTEVWLPIWWDTMIGSQLLDENSFAKLKYQFRVQVDPTIGTYNIEKLFTGIPYAWVDPIVFALYSAIDAYDTILLQKSQQSVFEREDMKNLYKLFMEIEMPVVSVVAKMENDGICIDTDFVERLDKKFKSYTEESSKKMYEILDENKKQVAYYQSIGKLDDPVNLSSPAQLAIVLYDILKAPVPEDDPDSRPTGADALKALKIPFSEALLKFRHYEKLITSYTSTLPGQISEKDGKVHASFHQLGKEDNNVVTGRFSSSNPNLQQVPSKETTMRMMFTSSPGYCIIGGDYSQQEPRLLASITQEKNLIETYNKNKDLYATVGSNMFHKDYWECMEKWENGTPNPDGKVIRSKCKQIILGKYNCPIKTA